MFTPDPNDVVAETNFGERLVVHRSGQRLQIGRLIPVGMDELGGYDLPSGDAFVIGRQLVCADGTGPERSLIVFGAVSRAHLVGSLSMELFEGRFTRSPDGVFLFLGSDPPIGGARWVLKLERRTVESHGVVLAPAMDPSLPAAERCAVFEPLD